MFETSRGWQKYNSSLHTVKWHAMQFYGTSQIINQVVGLSNLGQTRGWVGGEGGKSDIPYTVGPACSPIYLISMSIGFPNGFYSN